MEDSEVLVWLAVWVIFGGGIGAAIGSSKGRGGTGFILGLLLGFIGWIIVAVMDPTPEKMAETHQRIGAIANGGTGVVQRPVAQQWAPDPYGRHDHRLFDGELWTQRVSDAGQQSNDEPGYSVPGAPHEGWASDPFGRFAQRYYRNSQWTSHVAIDGTTYSDPASYPAPSLAPPPPPPPKGSTAREASRIQT